MRALTTPMLAAALWSAGCSVALNPRMPDPVTPVAGTPHLEMAPAARGMPEKIGHGTFTVFAIKIAPVRISNGPGDHAVMESLKRALTLAGYEVAEPASASTGPTLECVVRRFDFKNYTWLAPIVPTWGGIDLDLRLVDRDSRPLWQHAYTGSSWNLWFSFQSAVNRAMAEILDKVVKDVSTPEFEQACCPAAPPPSPTT